MRGATQSRPSKASLIARGLAAKPLKGKRIVKSKKVPDTKPGYSLYSTDSEDQASGVGRGLDRCAAFLTNILNDNDTKGLKKKKAAANKPIIKERGKPTPSTKSATTNTKTSSSNAKPIVIPTASHKDPGPSTSTLYNERLVASTPLLNSDERKQQQHLFEREQELTRQLHQLKQHYELLQRQKSPEIQEQQKRTLQNSMLHELDDYQQNEHDNMQMNKSPSPSKATPTVRKSLDYGKIPAQYEQSRINSTGKDFISERQLNTSRGSEHSVDSEDHVQLDTSHSSTLRSYSRQDNVVGPKKHVRVVSPDLSERYHPKTSPRRSQHAPLVYNKTEESVSPSAANNEVRTLQYLMKELIEVIGNNDDLEVNRLLMEIDHTCSLLPYLITASSPNKKEDEDLYTKRLRLENAHLKRKLQSATERTLEQEVRMKTFENIQSGQANVTFELAACRSENASLQKRLNEENEENKRLHKELGNLEKVVENLKEDKKKFIHILENKEQTHSKNRRSSQLESLKLSNEMRQLKAEVEAGKLSLEAARKESDILNLSLKQKDAEIERLDGLTKALNQSMRRVLGDIQDYTPNSGIDAVMANKEAVDVGLLSHISPLTGPRFTNTKQLSGGVAEVLDGMRASDTEYRHKHHRVGSSFLDGDGPLSTNQRIFDSLQKDSPLSMYNSRLSPYRSSINESPKLSLEEPVYFSPKASLGQGAWSEGSFSHPSPESKYKSPELSSYSSRDEEDFQRDLASLDADIARIQKNLRETAKRS